MNIQALKQIGKDYYQVLFFSYFFKRSLIASSKRSFWRLSVSMERHLDDGIFALQFLRSLFHVALFYHVFTITPNLK